MTGDPYFYATLLHQCTSIELSNGSSIEIVTEGETWALFEMQWIQKCAWVVPNIIEERSLLKQSVKELEFGCTAPDEQ